MCTCNPSPAGGSEVYTSLMMEDCSLTLRLLNMTKTCVLWTSLIRRNATPSL